jgi:hypothetical protein
MSGEERPRVARGPQPAFLECRDAERLLPMLLASAAEISALYDRLDTLERFILEHLDVPGERLEAVGVRAGNAAERAAWRRRFVERLLCGFERELAGESVMSDEEYRSFMESLAE